jgi:hypothetical protein
MKKIILPCAIVFSAFFLSGCEKQNQNVPSVSENNVPQKPPIPVISEKSCQIDADCSCGRHKDTKQCFFGNTKYIDPALEPCPDFCGGFDGKMTSKCVSGECKQAR